MIWTYILETVVDCKRQKEKFFEKTSLQGNYMYTEIKNTSNIYSGVVTYRIVHAGKNCLEKWILKNQFSNPKSHFYYAFGRLLFVKTHK